MQITHSIMHDDDHWEVRILLLLRNQVLFAL